MKSSNASTHIFNEFLAQDTRWPSPTRSPGGRVVLVVAVALLGASRVLTRSGALSPSESSVDPKSVLLLSSRAYACLA
jgi:hypothetical protein